MLPRHVSGEHYFCVRLVLSRMTGDVAATLPQAFNLSCEIAIWFCRCMKANLRHTMRGLRHPRRPLQAGYVVIFFHADVGYQVRSYGRTFATFARLSESRIRKLPGTWFQIRHVMRDPAKRLKAHFGRSQGEARVKRTGVPPSYAGLGPPW